MGKDKIELVHERDTEDTPAERIKEELAEGGSSNDEIHSQGMGDDMVDSEGHGVEGPEATGETGKVTASGEPGFQATGAPAPEDELQNQEEENLEEEEDITPPRPSPFSENP